jgi:alpha-amylase/alpha-mannosidase (GH57 family)
MERYLCIHGHFYQPPRENPWLEAVEIQDSAFPYHDWNERVTAECYAPNSAARIVDGDGKILDIVSNYARMSFNFGPTLLAWMEANSPEVYKAVLEADQQSREWRSGHGSALAQVYNHVIMPLASQRDKQTEVIWGIRDFEHRFGRRPEGMWLSETAVDMATLDVLAVQGIAFTVLAPHQASRVRQIGTRKWQDVSGGRIDPARPYLARLPSGRTISIFFYDGPISRAVAFEGLLRKGEDFAARLLSGFSDTRSWPQVLNIATDGETYGHHHGFGDMALAFAMNYVESNGLARLTNYGEYLEKHPPTHEVQILPDTSWSCVHGIERWRSNCGCNSGGRPDWNQEWRAPLRSALDWLRDELTLLFIKKGSSYLADPWRARDRYIDVILDRSSDNTQAYLNEHAKKPLDREQHTTVMKLLEMERHALLMYTSCAWFFDELSGIETVQVIEYAARAVQLAAELSSHDLCYGFTERLRAAKSNLREYGDGAQIFEKLIKPTMIDLKRVAAHYAVRSAVEDYAESSKIYSYTIGREDYQKITGGKMRLAMGRIVVTSEMTGDTEPISFCTLYVGGHIFNGGVRTFLGSEAYDVMKQEITAAFEQGNIAQIVHLMDTHFGMHSYSLTDLFRDEQRAMLELVLRETMAEFEFSYRSMYENNRVLMGFIREIGMPVPKAFLAAAEFTLDVEAKKSLQGGAAEAERLREIAGDLEKWNIPLTSPQVEFLARRKIEALFAGKSCGPSGLPRLSEAGKFLHLFTALGLEMNLWTVQNMYYRCAREFWGEQISRWRAGDQDALAWIEMFRGIGEMLHFNTAAVAPTGENGSSKREL